MRGLKVLPYAVGVAMASLGLSAPAQATFPDENGPIVFAADSGAGYQLYTVQPTGRHLQQVTRVDGDAVNPDWSPDGRKIVFELDHPSGPTFCSIELMNADGSDMVDLTGRRNGCEAQPSFTPDGTTIVFERFNDQTNVDAIWRMGLHGRNRERITTGSRDGATDPNVSPDGTTVSFIDFNGKDFGQALSTVPIGGGHITRLTPYRADVAIKQDWAPGGRRLVYTENADILTKPANIATIRPDGTGRRYLTHYRSVDLRAYTGSYSPNGQWIVFRLEDHGLYALYRMHPDGSDKRAILPLSSFKPRFIDWGPDRDR